MSEQPTPQASGRDLARQALAAYKVGRTPGQAPAGPGRKKTRRIREDRAGGRDPVGLGALLGRIADEQAWTPNLRGGSIIDQWPTLCPQFVDKVAPVEFREKTGQLVVQPVSDAYAAHLRLLGGQLCKQINDKVGTGLVRSLVVLASGPMPGRTTPVPAELEPATAPIPAGPVRTRETASDGYRLALAEHQAHRRTRETTMDAYVRAADERQAQALRARREPEEAFTDAVVQQDALEEQAGPPAGSMEASIRAALTFKHSGGRTEPRRLFEAS